jgi:hypothetical protein
MRAVKAALIARRFLDEARSMNPLKEVKEVWRTTGKDWPSNDSGRMYVQQLMQDGSWSVPIYVPDEPVSEDRLL